MIGIQAAGKSTVADLLDLRYRLAALCADEYVGAGFTCVVDRVADAEYLLVECTEAQRPQVRDVLESVHSDELHGAALSLGHVVFEDER